MKLNLIKHNSTLLEALGFFFPESSKTTLRSWIKEERIEVDGQPMKQANYPVFAGQQLSLKTKPKFIKESIRIVYEDQYLVAIDKPEGLLSVATAFEKQKTAHAVLQMHYQNKKVFVVHRLDQETSGVMLFALTEKCYLRLKSIFERHDIERCYCAIVEGKMAQKEGTWQSYLIEDNQYKVHTTHCQEQGKIAITHYKTLSSSSHFSQLSLNLETGRKNQIRVHCSDAGNPVIGDEKYGASTNPLRRLGLHACSIAFVHPITNKQMTFSSPLPQAFEDFLDKHA